MNCQTFWSGFDGDNDGSQYAWAANMGWLNGEPLGNGGPGMSLGEDSASGWLWSANAGWISLSCDNSASCFTVDYSVARNLPGLTHVKVARLQTSGSDFGVGPTQAMENKG